MEGCLGLDVCNTAHTGIDAKAEIVTIFPIRIQVFAAGHAQLIADWLSCSDLHLDAGVAVAVGFTGDYADFHRVTSGRDGLDEWSGILQLDQRVTGKERSGGKVDSADVQHIHLHLADDLFGKIGFQVNFAVQFVLERFVFCHPFGCRHILFSFLNDF